MADIQVNGEASPIDDGTTVADLLVVKEVKMPEMVTVELNGTILDRPLFGETVLKDGDKVEFMYFMGGGAAETQERQAGPA